MDDDCRAAVLQNKMTQFSSKIHIQKNSEKYEVCIQTDPRNSCAKTDTDGQKINSGGNQNKPQHQPLKTVYKIYKPFTEALSAGKVIYKLKN
jgi:hypothetical protein